VTTGGEEYRIVAVPITDLGNYALVLGRPLQPTNDILSSLWLVLIIFGVAGVIVAAVVGATVARSSLRPVRELSRAVEHISVTKELTPITIKASGDIAVLAESFNQMLQSLASSRDRQTQLIADAGHELRTPLTSLRTNIELLAADATTGMLKQQDRIDILADVKAQLVEFTDLIGDLVQLARDETTSTPELLDFRNVVNAALDRVRLRAHGLLFDVELNPFYVAGDSDMLERPAYPRSTCPSSSTASIAATLRGRLPGPGSVSRSSPRQLPNTEAGSARVAQPRAGPSSPFTCPEQPASRSSPSLRNPDGRLHHPPHPHLLHLPPPPLLPNPSARHLPKVVENDRVESRRTQPCRLLPPSGVDERRQSAQRPNRAA
jgi:HAMP domain-containing protein